MTDITETPEWQTAERAGDALRAGYVVAVEVALSNARRRVERLAELAEWCRANPDELPDLDPPDDFMEQAFLYCGLLTGMCDRELAAELDAEVAEGPLADGWRAAPQRRRRRQWQPGSRRTGRHRRR